MHAITPYPVPLVQDEFLSDLRARRNAEAADLARALPGASLLIALLLVAVGANRPAPPLALPDAPMPRYDLVPIPQIEEPRITTPMPRISMPSVLREPARVVPVARPVVDPVAVVEPSTPSIPTTSGAGIGISGEGTGRTAAPCLDCDDVDPTTPGHVWHDVLPSAVHVVKPTYPDLARAAGVEGTVRVWALVGRDGRVEDVRVHESVPMLDGAALSAVRSWRFSPARTGDQPVRSWVSIPLRFRLHD